MKFRQPVARLEHGDSDGGSGHESEATADTVAGGAASVLRWGRRGSGSGNRRANGRGRGASAGRDGLAIRTDGHRGLGNSRGLGSGGGADRLAVAADGDRSLRRSRSGRGGRGGSNRLAIRADGDRGLGRGRGGSRGSNRLAVRADGDSRRSNRRGGGGSHGLAIGTDRHGRGGNGLAIGADAHSGGSNGLTVRADAHGGGSDGLAVRADAHSGGSDRLAVGANRRGSGSSRLAVGALAGRAATVVDDVDVDGRAQGAPVAVVEVVELACTLAALTAVEDGRVTKGKRAVSANAEAIIVDGASLRWVVELQLVVAGDVAGATVLVRQLAIGQGQDQQVIGSAAGLILTRFQVALSDGLVGSGIDDGNAEGAGI